MSSRLLQVLLALSLLLNTFVLVGFVYRSWIAPPSFEHRMSPPGQRPSAFEVVTHEIGLDDSQRQKLSGVFGRYTTMRRERLREIQELREQIAAEYKQPTVDLTRVDALVDQYATLRASYQKDTLHTFNEMAAQLTPQQRERMHEILAERLATPRKRSSVGGSGSGHSPQPQ